MDGTAINSMCNQHSNINNRVEYWRGLVAYLALEICFVPTLFMPSPRERDLDNESKRKIYHTASNSSIMLIPRLVDSFLLLASASALYVRIARPLRSNINLSARTNIPCFGLHVK